MTDAITDKTVVLVTRLGDFWVTPRQGKEAMELKERDSGSTLEIDGNFVSCLAVDGVLTATAYDLLQKKRSGAWQCKYRFWHDRNQQCAHYETSRRGV